MALQCNSGKNSGQEYVHVALLFCLCDNFLILQKKPIHTNVKDVDHILINSPSDDGKDLSST